MTLEWALITCNKFDRMEERQNDLCPGNSFNNKISHYFCSVGNVAADNGENAPAVKKTYSELIKMCHFYGFVFLCEFVHFSTSQPARNSPNWLFALFFSFSIFFPDECTTDRCGRDPCRHGGKCLPSDQGAICLCPLGYGGDLCEMRLDLQVKNENRFIFIF